jgi:hypothetical protein
MLAAKNANKTNPRAAAPLGDGASTFGETRGKKRILHVEFDRSLLTTRHALLETAGFDVISCFSGVAARDVSIGSIHFDLFLLGHAASFHERAGLIAWARASFPNVPIVVLRSRDTDGFPLGDGNAIADPEELLTVIVDILNLR